METTEVKRCSTRFLKSGPRCHTVCMKDTFSKRQNSVWRSYGAWLSSFLVPFLIAVAVISFVEHQKLLSDSGKSEALGVDQSESSLWTSATNVALLIAVPAGLLGIASFGIFVVVSKHRKQH